MGWKLYDVEGASRPLSLSPEHAAALGAVEHGVEHGADPVVLEPVKVKPRRKPKRDDDPAEV